MGNIIATEIMKLKRSYMLWISLLIVAVGPLLNAGIYFGKDVNLNEIATNAIALLTMIIYPCLYGIIITYVFNREYQEDMMKTLLTIPISKNKLLIGKMALMFLWFLLLVGWNSLLTIISGIIINIQGVSTNNILFVLSVNLKTAALFFLCMLPILTIVVVSRKSYVLTLGVCIAITIGNFIAGEDRILNSIYPWAAISRFNGITSSGQEYACPKWVSMLIIISVGIVSVVLASRSFNKQEN